MQIRKVWLLALALFAMPIAQGSPWRGQIPFHLVRGFAIIVSGGVASSDHLNFLFDTGAVPSILSQRVASRVGVTGSSGPLATLSKNAYAQYVSARDVRFGSIRVPSLNMAILDLDYLERLLGVRIDAIIGLDLLDGQSFAIDYRHQVIESGISARVLHETPVETFSASGAPYLVLTAKVDAQSFRMLLDTGANDVVLFTNGTSAQTTSRQSRRQTLTIGEALFRQAEVVFQPSPLAAKQIDGLVGPAALHITRLEFDAEHGRIRWDREQ